MFRNTHDLQDYAIHATDGMVEEHLAQANYQIKVQAQQFRAWLERLETGWRKDN